MRMLPGDASASLGIVQAGATELIIVSHGDLGIRLQGNQWDERP